MQEFDSCNLLNTESNGFSKIIVGAVFDFIEHFAPLGVRKAKHAAAKHFKPILAFQFEPVDQVLLKIGECVKHRPLRSAESIVQDNCTLLLASLVIETDRE